MDEKEALMISIGFYIIILFFFLIMVVSLIQGWMKESQFTLLLGVIIGAILPRISFERSQK